MQDVKTEDVKTIAPTAAAEDAWNPMRFNRGSPVAFDLGEVVTDKDVSSATGWFGASRRHRESWP